MKKYTKFLILALCIITFLISICFIPIRASKLIPIVEEQVEKEFGVKIHLERLVLRVGPLLKVKAPLVHVMYEDGHKFAQLDNVKLYITWLSLLKDSPRVSLIQVNKLNVRLDSEDKSLLPLINRIKSREFVELPNIKLKNYKFLYRNAQTNNNYIFDGESFSLEKASNNSNLKLKTNGNFRINSQQFINYDVQITSIIEILEREFAFDFVKFMEQVKDLDFHSDIITDLKLYKNQEKVLQASGFVNLDNISILDISKKNPKSFVYLTLWGDKASILSNLYTSPDKKIYIEGMINNSKKNFLDIKVKTDEISINNLYKKLKIFLDFSTFKNINSIDGTLNANFTIRGNLKKIKSNGFFKISNASVKANGVQIDKINSEIDFSNNLVNIVKAVGYVNNSPINLQGTIGKNIDLKFLMDKVELKYISPEIFGVENGLASVIATISGTFENVVHKEKISIENFKATYGKNKLAFDSLKLDTNKNNTAYVSNINCTSPAIANLKIPSLKFLISSESVKIPDTNIYMPNSKLLLKGEILNYNNNNLSFVNSVSGFIHSKDIKSLSQYSTRYPVNFLISGSKLSQNIIGQIFLEKTDVFNEPSVINLVSKCEKNNLKIEDLSLTTLNGSFSNEFKANLKGNKKIIITGSIENIFRPIVKNLRIFIPQQLNINLFETLAQIKGDLFVNGDIKNPDIVGQLQIQNLFNQQLQFLLSNCTLDFNKNNIILNAPLFKLADSSMSINALISTNIADSIIIKTANIKSKYLNTDTILMYKDSPLVKHYPIKILDGKFYAERLLANVYDSPLYLSAFTSDFKLENELLVFKNIAADLFNGRLSGALDYNLRDEYFNSNIMARGVSAEPIFSVISTRKDNISGIMDFDAAIKGELTSKQSLNGNIKFIINNGRMSSLGKLEHLLYAQNVIADNMLRTSLSVVTKAITLKDTGLFKYLRGDVELENGIANIKMLQSQGPLMALYMKGIYNPLNDYAQLLVLGRLSDEIISGLGAFGDFSFNKLMVMLTGEEQKNSVQYEDFDKIPQLPMKNTKEFRSIINGNIDKPSSVKLFNWISYSQKSLKQKEIPLQNEKIPDFVEALPY